MKKYILFYPQMGGLYSSYGIERLLDPSISMIDLRSYGKTNNYGYNPIYIIIFDKKRYLFVDYFGTTYNLGFILKSNFISEIDTNSSYVIMQNGRCYVTYTYLTEIEYDNRIYVDINRYLPNSYNNIS